VSLIIDLIHVLRIYGDCLALFLVMEVFRDFARVTVAFCPPSAAAKNVAITAHQIANSHFVSADRARLRQVFWNLLNNAVKFTDNGGNILVRSANVSDTTVTVSIRDSGVGMDSAVLETLFTPFDRRPADHDPDSRMGLGLGLAICKGIVGAHGGQLWATSEGPGHGSTFGVELATSEAPPANEESPAEPASGVGDSDQSPGFRVLIIEDDPDSGEMLALFLRHHGYEVVVALSLHAGLARLDENWDVVLSDIGLPDGSGLEIARRARELPNPPQRLIAFTGYGSEVDIGASREAGFDEHIVKPIDLKLLLTVVTGAQPTL